MTKKTDEDLKRAVYDGDHTVYKMLVNAHVKSVSRCAYRILGNKNDAADICQKTFLGVWHDPNKKPPKPFTNRGIPPRPPGSPRLN